MYYDIAKSSIRIRELRVATGCTQEFVAEQIGISLDGYRKLERGVNGAKVDTLVAIAEFYDVSLDYLVSGCEYQSLHDIFVGLTERETNFMSEMLKCIKENIGLLK